MFAGSLLRYGCGFLDSGIVGGSVVARMSSLLPSAHTVPCFRYGCWFLVSGMVAGSLIVSGMVAGSFFRYCCWFLRTSIVAGSLF